MITNNSEAMESTPSPLPPIVDQESSPNALDTGTEAGSDENKKEITKEQLSLRKRLLNWRTILPLVIAIALLVYFIQKAQIDPQKTWQALQQANLWLFAAAFIVYYFSLIIRAVRWRVLLQNAGYTKEKGIQLPGLPRLIEIIYISFFANVIVPAKLGDLYRAYLLRQEINVSTTRSFGTVLAERLLDMIMLLVLLIPALMVSLRDHLPQELMISLMVLLGVVVVGIAGLIVLRWLREPIAKFVPARFREQYYHFQEGTLGSFKRLPSLSILTLGIWGFEVLRFFLVAASLNLFSGSLLHVLAAATVIGLVVALLTAIPATGGGVGIVETGMLGMLTLFTQGANAANVGAAAIILDRVISYVSVLVIGFLIFLWAFGRKAAKEASKN